MAVLASREFEVVAKDARGSAQVRVFMPERAPNGEWICRLQFQGFSQTDDQPHAYRGVDGWQALIHAMKVSPTIIAGTAEFAEGRLRFGGEMLDADNLGRTMQVGDPVPEVR